MTKSQKTKNEQQKDLCITVEKQVWESTLHRSMVLQAENDKLKEQINHLSRTQARQIKYLKELLTEYNKYLSEIKNAYIDLTTQDEYGSYYIDEAKLFVEIVEKTIKDFDEHKIDNAIGEK